MENRYSLGMPRRLLQGITFGWLLAAGTLFGQVPAAAPAFEVASIKPAAPINAAQVMAGKIHIGVNIDAARVDIGNLSLMGPLGTEYDIARIARAL